MSDIKKLAQRVYDDVFSEGKLDAADEIIASGAIDHNPPPGIDGTGPEGLKRVAGMFRAAFPDLTLTAEDMVAEGDLITVRWSSTGTHKGELMGIPATGKTVNISGMDMMRMKDGKIVEHWGIMDDLGMMQQLGLIPAK